MSVQNGERLVTKQDLADFYNDIRPYMGGIVTSKAGFTPIGTIISVMGTTAPVNYLACDGTVYNIADYTELANYFNEQFGSKNFFGGDGATTFAVPDLRGEFLRGTGTNSHANQGSGASVGVHQDGTSHNNFIVSPTNNRLYGYTTTKTSNQQNLNKDTEIVGVGYVRADGSWTDNTEQTALYTSRPTNTSVLYCIATKNFYIDPTLDYSTEEKIVGTWIDGKPLYQKTISIASTSRAWGVIYTVENGSNINIVQAKYYYSGSGVEWIKMNYTNGSDILLLATDANKIVMNGKGFTFGANNPVEMTIQYTKTN